MSDKMTLQTIKKPEPRKKDESAAPSDYINEYYRPTLSVDNKQADLPKGLSIGDTVCITLMARVSSMNSSKNSEGKERTSMSFDVDQIGFDTEVDQAEEESEDKRPMAKAYEGADKEVKASAMEDEDED